MKKCSRNCYITTIAGLIIGFIGFYLLSIGCMCVPSCYLFFIASIAVWPTALLGFLLATLIAKKPKALKEIFYCYGNLAVTEEAGTILVAFLTSTISYHCFLVYFLYIALTLSFNPPVSGHLMLFIIL